METYVLSAIGADRAGLVDALAGVIGPDRHGIVHGVAHVLAELGVGIVDRRTGTESAAMAGEALVRIEAVVRMSTVTPNELAAALEGLADA